MDCIPYLKTWSPSGPCCRANEFKDVSGGNEDFLLANVGVGVGNLECLLVDVGVDIGLVNNEVKSQRWVKTGRTRLKLKSDVQTIFKNQHAIQIALISEFGNTLQKLSHNSGGSHPTAEAIFEGIMSKLHLTHIPMFANAPYVALKDTTCWQAINCELIGNLRNSVQEAATQPCIEDIMDLQFRNRAREKEASMKVSLEDAVGGPGNVVWKLIQDARNHPTESIGFNEDQRLVIALCIWPLAQAWQSRMNTRNSTNATVNTLHKLPIDLGLPRSLITGGGGCGKTTIMQVAVVHTLCTFFQAVVLIAPSNRAARQHYSETHVNQQQFQSGDDILLEDHNSDVKSTEPA